MSSIEALKRLWVPAVFLAVVLGLLGGRTFPASAAPQEDRPAGSWFKARSKNTGEAREDLTEERREALLALGYLGGYESVPANVGVVSHDPERALPGYNLYASGHGPQAILTDMTGRVVHSWQRRAPRAYKIKPQRNFWRRVHLLPGGELLAIFDPHGIVKLDKASNLLWATDGSHYLHHDLFVTAEGRIHALGKRAGVISRIHPTLTLLEDFVVVFDSEGQPLEQFSILEAFERSPYGPEMLEKIRQSARNAKSDYWEDFHTNTIEVFDGSQGESSPHLKRGNMIFCSPHHGNVFIIDGETRTVVWNWFGPWHRIHHPTVLAGGRFLLFNNNGYKRPRGIGSQVLEYELATRREVWRYEGDPANPESTFFSGTSSTAGRLANGNTLIVATESGRAIEVTADGHVVWEFFSPKRAGENNELIASLFQLERVPAEAVSSWLDETD